MISAKSQLTRSVIRATGMCLLLAAGLSMTACATPSAWPLSVIEPPPPALALPAYYVRSLDVIGIPVSSSAKVSDAALRISASLITEMLEHRPDLTRVLVARKQRVVIMAQDEGTLDLPEFSGWKKPTRDDPSLQPCQRKHYDEWIAPLTDAQYWNWRARGLGGVLVLGASENVLGIPTTQYYGENILVHEFGHAILDAVEAADPKLYRDIQAAYLDAKNKGSWRGEYGDTNVQEYWAEGTQFWFESNMLVVINGEHVLSATDLTRHDSALAAVLRRVYGRRHHLTDDIFWRHPSRAPAQTPSADTAMAC